MIRVRNLNCGYGNNLILEKISCEFHKGEIISVIGPNGAGKSTFLKTLGKIIPKLSGEILINGQNTEDMKSKELSKNISFLAQGQEIPDMTVFQMVLHGRFPYTSYPKGYSKEDYEYAKKAIKVTGISDKKDMDLKILSGGMRQMAYISMAICQNSDFILLDEPATYLDINHQIRFMKTLKNLAKDGKGIIAVMHDLPLAFKYLDKILLIDDKKEVMYKTPKEMLKSGIIKEIFNVELCENEENYYYNI